MKLAFLSVIAAGTAIGLFLPGAKKPAPPPVVAAAVAEHAVETVLERESNGHFYTAADVNDEPIRFVVDTGATTVALTVADARRAHIPVNPAQFEVVGMGAGGAVRGQRITIRDIVLDGKHATDLTGVVLEGADISLLGQSYLRTLGTVEIKGDTMSLR